MLSGIGAAAQSAAAWHAGRGRPARAWARTCRTIWKSTCSSSRPQPITLLQILEPLGQGGDRRAVAVHRQGPRRVEPVRGLRLHPLATPGSNIPTSSITSCPSPCAMTARRRRAGMDFRCIPARCGQKSRGAVTLRSGDPHDAAGDPVQLHVRTLTDWEDFRACIRLTREIFAQPAMAAHVKARDPAGAEPAIGCRA